MSAANLSGGRWEELLAHKDELTCYSAALATWLAGGADGDEWARFVNTGLYLKLTEAGAGLLGFAYFPAELRARVGLVRTGAQDAGGAIDGVLSELERSGRVIVAGDAFNLHWCVGHERVHTPHWYVISGIPDALEVADPFACRTELGTQEATRGPVSRESLDSMLRALPPDNAVHRLREELAFGDECTDALRYTFQWFVKGEVGEWIDPDGLVGGAAIGRLAQHFRDHGQDPDAYLQADDIWSIARHRAFMCRYYEERAGSDGTALPGWLEEHGRPLARRWSHLGPLLMQATLALAAGRPASGSVPQALEKLAELEDTAAASHPQGPLPYAAPRDTRGGLGG
jgi:hypothetical protein